MSSKVRIAVVATAEPTLQELLQALPSQPVVRAFAALIEASPAIHAFAPRVLFLDHGPQFAENLVALRILTALIPELAVVVLCDEAAALDVLKTYDFQGIRVLPRPFTTSQLQQAVAFATSGTSGSDAESYLQFVQGICDEINNPLLFSSGHLQLLESRMDQDNDRPALAQIAAIREGLQRIKGTMRKVNNMSRASQGDRMHEEFTMGTLLALTEEQLGAAGLSLAIDCTDELRIVPMHGDLALLAGALFSLAQVGLELRDDERDELTLQVCQSHTIPEVRMLVEKARLQGWELPKTFEPYHLNRVLQGTTLGLNLFLVQRVCQAHGGEAIARRLSEASVEFRISLGSQNNLEKPRK